MLDSTAAFFYRARQFKCTSTKALSKDKKSQNISESTGTLKAILNSLSKNCHLLKSETTVKYPEVTSEGINSGSHC